jgi:hypothetical protein
VSDEALSKHDHVLLGLVMTLQYAAMQQLGKLTSPMTGKVERDLEAARTTIDLLEMLKVKCRAGTPAAVLQPLDTAVMELQMNYLDEVRKDQSAQPAAEPADEPAAESAAPAADGEGATA